MEKRCNDAYVAQMETILELAICVVVRLRSCLMEAVNYKQLVHIVDNKTECLRTYQWWESYFDERKLPVSVCFEECGGLKGYKVSVK